jgi:hypothetical protein
MPWTQLALEEERAGRQVELVSRVQFLTDTLPIRLSMQDWAE